MTLTQLEMARALELPSREATLKRNFEAQDFWVRNKLLLTQAWQEWEENQQSSQFVLDDSLLDSQLRDAVNQAWQDPSNEGAVKKLWQEVSPGVYKCQFFDPERLTQLRDYLESTFNANIPLRAPYGIVLNRGGAMLDARSEGFLAAPSFQKFYRNIIDIYMRPIARLLFPEITGHDSQTFGFSIKYQAGTDTSLRLHTDASAVTMNVNLNLPGEHFSGSGLDFYDPNRSVKTAFNFEPGVATLHRGHIPHAAKAITAGERTNLVFWLYGENGFVPYGNKQQVPFIDAKTRWVKPDPNQGYDNYAPF